MSQSFAVVDHRAGVKVRAIRRREIAGEDEVGIWSGACDFPLRIAEGLGVRHSKLADHKTKIWNTEVAFHPLNPGAERKKNEA